ncbi:MAG TPA: hypothetical protein VN493_11650 [Thermoanaerobaculia bacterium]|nr:hypothetical protein [Thermoanaerobaculia bacterium]
MAEQVRMKKKVFDPGGTRASEKEDGVLPFKRPDVPMKRVSFYIPEPLYEDLQEFARERGDTMTGLLRWSLGIGKAVWDEIKDGKKIRSDAPDGSSPKEFVFGRY